MRTKLYIFVIIASIITSVSIAQELGKEVSISASVGEPRDSGFYQAHSPSNTGCVPDSGSDWSHIINARHSNTANNRSLQISSSFANNDRLFFRKIMSDLNINNPEWIEIATRGDNTFYGNQIIRPSSGAARLEVFSSGNDYPRIAMGGDSTVTAAVFNRLNSQTHLYFGETTDSGNYYFRGTGSIGIGTANVNGHKLAVAGSIRAHEVVVNTGWADFVFEDTYELRSLHEVEEHIQTHGHLPDVPPAAVITSEGLSVGEAQKIMMQKIEELTLYMIEQEKKNQTQQVEIEGLKKQLSQQ